MIINRKEMQGGENTGNGNQVPFQINSDPEGEQLKKIVNHLSRQRVDLCWHCLACGGGCPFSEHMDLLPNQVIRLIQLGKGREALDSKTIWVCVGCHTCSGQCPNRIDIAAIMDALRQLAIREGIAPRNDAIYLFHKYIYESIQRRGRLNKLEAMVQFKVGTGQLFSDLQIGMRMLTRGKLELLPQGIKNKGELADIFAHYNERRRSFDPHE
jgi:heterodisulfide reductase subunit C